MPVFAYGLPGARENRPRRLVFRVRCATVRPEVAVPVIELFLSAAARR